MIPLKTATAATWFAANPATQASDAVIAMSTP